MQQRIVVSHKFDVSRYNILMGEVLFTSVGPYYNLFEVAYGASSLLTKSVCIEQGSVVKISGKEGIKPVSSEALTSTGSISLKDCSFPMQYEFDWYKKLKIGI